jgi:hypothetical protein
MITYEDGMIKDFDLSIIMPFYKKFHAFSKVLPMNAPFLQRSGIEVIVVLDEPSEKDEVLALIRAYSGVNWIIIVNSNVHLWRNPAKAINVGIKNSTKEYVMICSPESFFRTDAIFNLRTVLEFYQNSFAIGKVFFAEFGDAELSGKMSLYYGSIMAKKCHLVHVCCYNEEYDSWGGEDDHIRAKMEYFGYKKIVVENAVLIHYEESVLGIIAREKKPRLIPNEIYKNANRPKLSDFMKPSWGDDFSDKLFDYRNPT